MSSGYGFELGLDHLHAPTLRFLWTFPLSELIKEEPSIKKRRRRFPVILPGARPL